MGSQARWAEAAGSHWVMKNQRTVAAALELDGRATPLWHQSTRCPASLTPVLQPHRPLHCSCSVWEARRLPPTGFAPAAFAPAWRALLHVCARLRFLIRCPVQLSPLKMPPPPPHHSLSHHLASCSLSPSSPSRLVLLVYCPSPQQGPCCLLAKYPQRLEQRLTDRQWVPNKYLVNELY